MKIRKPNKYEMPIIIFLSAIAITLVFWHFLPASFLANESSDYIGFYEPVARNILAGNGFVLPNGAPGTAYPPGYSFILAIIFGIANLTGVSEQLLLMMFVLSCVGLSSVFVFLLGNLIWGTIGGIIPAAIWMTYPFMLWLTKQPNSEMPFIVFFYAGIYYFAFALFYNINSWYIHILAGLLIGCAMLVRPIAVGVILIMICILWFVRQKSVFQIKLKLSILLLLGCIVLVAPWELWLYSTTKTFPPLSTNGPSSIRDGLTFGVNTKNYRQPISVPNDVAQLMNQFLDKYGELKPLNEIEQILFQTLWKNPLVVTKLFLIKAARSWYATDSGRFELPTLFIQIVYIILALAGGVFAWKKGGLLRPWMIIIIPIILYFWGMTTIVLSILRYLTPVMGLLFTLIPGLFLKSRMIQKIESV